MNEENIILSKEENNHLAILARYDKEARERLVNANMRLIHSVINIYQPNEQLTEELVQEGVYGLLRAVHTYDMEKGSFSSHAFRWIRSMILKTFWNMDPIHYDAAFYNKRIRYQKLKDGIGGNPTEFTDMELKDVDLTQDDVKKIQKYSRQVTSSDSLMENGIEVEDNNFPTLEENVEQMELSEAIKEAIEKLNPKEQFVVCHFYGIGCEQMKMSTIAKMMAKELNLPEYTRQYVLTIRKNAEKKLKANKKLQSFALDY